VTRRTWSLTTLVLAGVLLLLVGGVAAASLVRDDGTDDLVAAAAPWRDDRDVLTAQHKDVAAAARAEVLAFLAVDYRDMDPIVDRVLEGATGAFAEQYADRRRALVRRAVDNRTVATPTVVALGVADLRAGRAVVHVAADSRVSGRRRDASGEVRHHRLQLEMVREGGEWLTSSLQFVG
jgi:Mce-associated membrane protein